jgi:uncharacterized membrane protein YvbJ
LINCPNCGTPVREDARFCGNCGIDVQAALAAHEQAMAAQAAAAFQQQTQAQPIQQSYPLQTTNYGGYGFAHEERSPMQGRLLITAVLVVAVACAFCCGVLVTAAFFEFATPATPKPIPSPTKQTFEFIQTLIQLAI